MSLKLFSLYGHLLQLRLAFNLVKDFEFFLRGARVELFIRRVRLSLIKTPILRLAIFISVEELTALEAIASPLDKESVYLFTDFG